MGEYEESTLKQRLINLAITHISVVNDIPEIRQAASALLYNIVMKMDSLIFSDTDNTEINEEEMEKTYEIVTEVVSASLEGIEEEKDAICLGRRLKILAKLGEKSGRFGRELIESLNGFEQIQSLSFDEEKLLELKILKDSIMILFQS